MVFNMTKCLQKEPCLKKVAKPVEHIHSSFCVNIKIAIEDYKWSESLQLSLMLTQSMGVVYLKTKEKKELSQCQCQDATRGGATTLQCSHAPQQPQ